MRIRQSFLHAEWAYPYHCDFLNQRVHKDPRAHRFVPQCRVTPRKFAPKSLQKWSSRVMPFFFPVRVGHKVFLTRPLTLMDYQCEWVIGKRK